jgi:hypothetical protein
MFGLPFTSRKNSNRSVRRNRTLSANLDPRKIPNNRPASRPATRSFLNSMRQKSKAVRNSMRTSSKAVRNSMRTTSKAVRNSMRTTRRALGTAINSMKLTHGARRRVRNRRDEARRNILEMEIKSVIERTSPKELKKELLRNLDEKINFRIHSGENFYTYYTCDRSTKNETMVDDYSYIINQMIYYTYYKYSPEIKNALREVKKEVDSRMHHCEPTERKRT